MWNLFEGLEWILIHSKQWPELYWHAKYKTKVKSIFNIKPNYLSIFPVRWDYVGKMAKLRIALEFNSILALNPATL